MKFFPRIHQSYQKFFRKFFHGKNRELKKSKLSQRRSFFLKKKECNLSYKIRNLKFFNISHWVFKNYQNIVENIVNIV